LSNILAQIEYDQFSFFVSPFIQLRILEDGYIVPKDQGGAVILHSEWKTLCQKIDLFYNSISQEDLEELIRLKQEERSKALEERRSNRQPEPKKQHPGYVYLLKSDSGLYKISRTSKIADRVSWFTTKLPFKVELIHSFKCENMVETERQLHERFSDKQHTGEWFNLSDEDVEYIKGLK
jgi:hypothetical protein